MGVRGRDHFRGKRRIHEPSPAHRHFLSVDARRAASSVGGFCNEFTGSSYKAERVKRTCKGQGGTFLAGACPTEGRVGTCRVYKGRNDESLYRYYKNFPGFGVKPKGGVAAAAESQCAKLKGTWTPN